MLARPVVHVGVLGALALVLFLAGVAREPLAGDPAMYATIAKTVAVTGEWTHLTFNGEPYLNKPPLFFWLNALVFRALGATTWTATLLPSLLGVVAMLLVYALARATLGGWESGFAAGLVYLTTPEVVHWSRGVHLETLVTVCILIGLFAAYRSLTLPAAIVLLGGAAAAGWLAKGPQGLFPLGVAAILWWRDGVLARRILSGWTLAATGLVAILVGPWLVARLGEGSGFAHVYFAEQIGAVLLEGGELERGPLWYLGKLLRTYWPWLPVAGAGLVLLARREPTSLGARLWLVYAALVLIVISAAAGKKSRYLFQLYPALAVAAGMALAAAAERVPRLLEGLLAAATVAALVVAVAGGERMSDWRRQWVESALAVAASLPPDARVWLTHGAQYGEPRIGKTIGFYAAPLLRTCRALCAEEAGPGDRIVSRAGEVEGVSAAHPDGGVRAHGMLAVVTLPPAVALKFR